MIRGATSIEAVYMIRARSRQGRFTEAQGERV